MSNVNQLHHDCPAPEEWNRFVLSMDPPLQLSQSTLKLCNCCDWVQSCPWNVHCLVVFISVVVVGQLMRRRSMVKLISFTGRFDSLQVGHVIRLVGTVVSLLQHVAMPPLMHPAHNGCWFGLVPLMGCPRSMSGQGATTSMSLVYPAVLPLPL